MGHSEFPLDSEPPFRFILTPDHFAENERLRPLDGVSYRRRATEDGLSSRFSVGLVERRGVRENGEVAPLWPYGPGERREKKERNT